MKKVIQTLGITLVLDPELQNVYLRQGIMDSFICKAEELTLKLSEEGYFEYRIGQGHRLVVDTPDEGVVTVATYKDGVMDVFLNIEDGRVSVA